ncbi:MAG: hypothetical protein ACLT3Y_00110 [Ruminococcus callidus]
MLEQQQERLPGLQTAYKKPCCTRTAEQNTPLCGGAKKVPERSVVCVAARGGKAVEVVAKQHCPSGNGVSDCGGCPAKAERNRGVPAKDRAAFAGNGAGCLGYDVAAAEQRLAAMRSEKAQTEKAFQLEQQQQQQCSQTAKAVRKAHSTLG